MKYRHVCNFVQFGADIVFIQKQFLYLVFFYRFFIVFFCFSSLLRKISVLLWRFLTSDKA